MRREEVTILGDAFPLVQSVLQGDCLQQLRGPSITAGHHFTVPGMAFRTNFSYSSMDSLSSPECCSPGTWPSSEMQNEIRWNKSWKWEDTKSMKNTKSSNKSVPYQEMASNYQCPRQAPCSSILQMSAILHLSVRLRHHSSLQLWRRSSPALGSKSHPASSTPPPIRCIRWNLAKQCKTCAGHTDDCCVSSSFLVYSLRQALGQLKASPTQHVQMPDLLVSIALKAAWNFIFIS